MNKREFSDWLSTFRKSINGYRYYTDFEKVYENAEKFKIEINILNSLIGSKRIEEDFEEILNKYPECIKVIPLLLAVREAEIYCQDEKGAVNYSFRRIEQSIEQYKYFMRETGLFDMLENHLVSNLYDYMLGVEVGLGSNGRKNRGGHQMEDLVEQHLKECGVEYYKEMYLTEIEEKWDVDLSAISADGTTTKRWDFVVKTEDKIFVIETNFYTSGGSKLNETARSYKTIALEANQIKEVEFVWITDGGGWTSARRNLEETYQVMDYVFNIADMESKVFEELFEYKTK